MKESPLALFRKHGGQLRMSEAIAHGITRHMLYSLRNKIGMDIVIEALKIYRSRQKINLEKLLAFAEVCRIKR